jgi:hypothetical protein
VLEAHSAAWGSCYLLGVPLARILVFVLALTHVVGLADLVLGEECEQLCQDDGCGKDCLPGAACRCHCPSAMPALGAEQVVAKVVTPEPVMLCAYVEHAHLSPDPREILHVPKLAV